MENQIPKHLLTDDVKHMSTRSLELLAVQIREKLLDDVSSCGGHLASNLGVVELTLALHRVFDVYKDRIVWDVGHQTYVHKLLTGRWDDMTTLRQLDGLSGFPKRMESRSDAFDSGHSGSSVSAAFGYAKARDLKGEDYACVAVIGDGALNCGVSFEALNSAGAEKTPLIVVLNDNEMSISKNVGGVAKHLQQLRTSAPYLGIKKSIKTATANMPRLQRGLTSARDTLKYAIVPGVIFEQMGFKYYGPVDGHDIDAMTTVLQSAKEQQRPVFIHVITKKGKGFIPAEKNPSKFHGIGPFDPSMAISADSPSTDTYSALFGAALAEEAAEDDRIVAITAAMTDATGLSIMKEKFPNRVFDAGIAEQHAVSFAAGLALGGLKPVVAIYSTFLQRAYDQVITEVCLQNLPVVFALDRSGVTGRDGETHQGSFDIAYLSSMPNMTVLAPKDGPELVAMLQYALNLNGPVAIRYPRGKAADLSEYAIAAGVSRPQQMRDGRYMCILAAGSSVSDALKTAEILDGKNIHCAVYNLRVLKPLNETFLDGIFEQYRHVITLEDGDIYEGVGMRIAAYAAERQANVRIKVMGWPDRFIEHGGTEELKERYGLDAASIAETAVNWLEEQD
ncbi:MAG: 1-deoxy-D-xylulose-5-phosphate synthase [Firmicutes bacterium]|nr:1-deoxy-D-xylulose-5-phosphate synthase [Bacillota bacterium]